ncbi:hypothetical protein TWF730_002631 [Orbilia blumenaviensis]|uniref:Uncharacterized protein n=1 Tax=Orbilia blumenaviensis TaxID=1796055 RepID=A0AAV9UEM1_9PEZI
MKSQLLRHTVILLLRFLASYVPTAYASPAIAPPAAIARGAQHSPQFSRLMAISASLSLGTPSSKTVLPLPPAPPLLVPPSLPTPPSTSNSSPISRSSAPPSSAALVSSTAKSTFVTTPPPPITTKAPGQDGDRTDSATSLTWQTHDLDPKITREPKSTWIQDDYPPQPPTNTSHPSTNPTSLPNHQDLTCERNFPSRQSLAICNTPLLLFLFLLFYIATLRAVLYLQEKSARQVLDLGEVLAKCRDSHGGYAWETKGSWKIRQQPELPAVAMLTVDDMERIVFEGGGKGGTDGYGTMKNGEFAGRERIWLQDLDYRRRKVKRRRDTTPDTSVKGKTKVSREEEGDLSDQSPDGTPTAPNGSDTTATQAVEARTTALTPEQQSRVAERRQEMVKIIHRRMLDDTKSKRVFYGAFVVFWTVGVAFLVIGFMLMAVCRQISKIGRCPF